MPDVMSAETSIPDYFTQIDSILSEGERLLGTIPPDTRGDTVAMALDKFTISRELLGLLKSCVNVLKAGGEPDQPPTDHNVGRSWYEPSTTFVPPMFPTGDDGRPIRNRHV